MMQYYSLAADVLAENERVAYKLLSPVRPSCSNELLFILSYSIYMTFWMLTSLNKAHKKRYAQTDRQMTARPTDS